MTDVSRIKSLPDGSMVMLRGSRKKAMRFTPKSLSLAVASAYQAASSSISQAITGLSITLAGLAHAQAQSSHLPQGGVAVHGSATFQQNGTTLNVNTSNGAGTNNSIINWQSFNIGAGHTTNINQPNANSSSLNRVITNTPSQIYGTLRSNGNVILVNQNGIAVGAGGVVDTAGFTASTLNISDADAKAGKLRFQGNALSGGVQIDGVIRSSNGDILLFAPNVAVGKDGLVKADNGNVIVGAGQSVEVTGRGLEGVKFIIQGADNKAINLGTLQGNAVGVFAGTLRHSGVIQAQSATMEGGRVVLRAIKDVEIVRDPSLANAPKIIADGGVNAQGVAQSGGNIQIQSTQGNVTIGAGSTITANAGNSGQNSPIAGMNAAGGAINIEATLGRVITEAGSQISATGHPGGTIRIYGGQEARIASAINASSPSMGAADAAGTLQLINAANIGGTIQILSPGTVSLDTGAQLTASGDAGGGTILVGGDYQGANAAITNAQNTNISSGVLLEANARVNGKGGKVIVWADNDTHFSGTLHAKGGSQGGDGGFGETSGKKNLYFRGRADLSARRGRVGTLLLDPDEILIQGGSGSSDPNFTGGTITAGAGGTLATIYEDDLEAISASADILLEAANKINFGLTLFGGGGLVLANGLTLRTTNATSTAFQGVRMTGMNLSLTPQFTIQAGGNIVIEAGTAWAGGAGGPDIIFSEISGAEKVSLVSTGGSITMKAAGGLRLGNGTVINANKAVNISTGNYGGIGDILFNGINLTSGAQIQAESVAIHAKGSNSEINIGANSGIVTTGSAGISLTTDQLLMNALSSTLNAGTGDLSIRTDSLARGINLGGTNDGDLSNLHLSAADISQMNAANIRIGNSANTADIFMDANPLSDINFGSATTVAITTGGSVFLNSSSKALIASAFALKAGSTVDLSGSDHEFNTIAAESGTGFVRLMRRNNQGYSVGVVDGLSGVTSGGTATIGFLSFFVPTQVVTLKADVLAEGDININNTFNSQFTSVIIGAPTVTIDSNRDNLGNSGTISVGASQTSIGVDAANRILILDSSTTEAAGLGGNIQLGQVNLNTPARLEGITLNSSAPTAANSGNITLPDAIKVGSAGATITGRTMLTNAAEIEASGAGAISFNGEIQQNNNLTLNTDSGSITLNAVVGNGTPIGNLLLNSVDGTVNINQNINLGGVATFNAFGDAINVANNVTIYSGGAMLLQVDSSAAANTISVGTNTRLSGDGVNLVAVDGMSLGGQIFSSGNIGLSSTQGAVTMGINGAIYGVAPTGAKGSKSIDVYGSAGVTLGTLVGVADRYNATVTTGAGQTIASAASNLVNFSTLNASTLGSAAGRSNIGSSGSYIALGKAGAITAYGASNLHLSSSNVAEDIQIAHASVDATSGNAAMDIISQRNIQINGGTGISVLGTKIAEIKLQAANTFEALTGISGNGSNSSVFILANDQIILNGGGNVSNLGSLSLSGKNTSQAIRFVDSDTVTVDSGSLNIAYGSLNLIDSSVGHVVIGKTDLSSGNITFEGTNAFSFAPSGAKNYSFFSGGDISSTAIRNMDLAQVGFTATGNVSLGNVALLNSNLSSGVILAAKAGAAVDLKVTDADGVTLTTVGGSLPVALTGIATTGGSNITLTNLNGGITSGAADFDIYTGSGTVTVKAYQDIGTVANPLSIHGSSFTLGNESGGVFQNLIAVALTRNNSVTGTVLTSETSFDTGNQLGDNIYLAAGFGTNTLEIDDNIFGTGNVINRTLSNVGGNIRVTQANALFSGTGTMTLDANSVTFEKLTTIAAGHTINATASNSTIVSGLGGLGGSGTFNNTGKTLIVDGTIAPGNNNAIGTLSILGGLTMGSTGIMELQTGTVANDGDFLSIGGALDATVGTLRLLESAPTLTAAGTGYVLGSFGSRTGSFATIDQPTANFALSFAGNNITATPSSLINKWINTNDGFWGTAGANANWSRGVTPTSAHDVWIDVASVNPIVTVGSAAVANSLHVGDTLNLNASLALTGVMALLNGGTWNHTVGGGSNITAGNNITIDAGGVMNWSGGTIGSAADTSQLFTNNGTVNITGPASSFQTLYRNWNNTGAVNWFGGRETSLANNALGQITLTNSGTISLQSTLTSGTTSFVDGGLGSIINASGGQINVSNLGTHITEINSIQNALTNQGAITINSGTALVRGPNATAITDTGSYFINAGSTLSFDTAKRTLSAAASIGGTGHLRVDGGGTLTINNGAAVNPLLGGSVEVLSGRLSLQGSAPQIVNLKMGVGATIEMPNNLLVDTLTSTGGTFLDAGTLTTGTTVNIATNQFTRQGGNWINNANMTVSGGANIYLNANSVLTNGVSGVIDFQSTSSSAILGGSGTNIFINNGALINKAGSATRGIYTDFNNSGSVQVDSGILQLHNATVSTGDYTVASGAALQMMGGISRNFTSGGFYGAGTLLLTNSSNTTLGGGVNTSLIQNGTVSLDGGNLTLNSSSGHIFFNPVTIAQGSTLSIAKSSSGALNVISGGTLTSGNAGTVWTLSNIAASNFSHTAGNTFSVLGNVSLLNAVNSTANFSGGGTLQVASPFTNNGLINLSGNGTLGGAGGFVNGSTGTLSRNTSTGVFSFNTPFTTQQGTVSADKGVLNISGAVSNAGLIQGTATIAVGGVGLTNSTTGTIAPGGIGAVGKLSITGAADLSQGKLLFDLDTAGFYDRVSITGNVTLGAPIVLNDISGDYFVGTNFNLLNYSGTASGTLPTLDTTAVQDATYTRSTTASTGGTLFVSVNSLINRWSNSATDDNWNKTTNWTRGHVPTASEDVIISPIATKTVTLSGGPASALSLTLTGDDSLHLNSGAVLTLGTGASTIGAGTTLLLDHGDVIGNTATLNNQGTIRADANASLIQTGTFNNSGLIEVSNGASLAIAASGTETGSYNLLGSGLLAVKASRDFSGRTIDGTGSVVIDGASAAVTLSNTTGGTWLSAGTLGVANGTLSVSGGVEVSNLNLSDGTISTLSGNSLEVSVSLSATGGTITGLGTFETSGASSVSGNVAVDAGYWVNSGILTFTPQAQFDSIQVFNNSLFENTSSGTLIGNNLEHFAIFEGATIGSGGGVVSNAGDMELNGVTSGVHYLDVPQFNNTGKLKLDGNATFGFTPLVFNQQGTLTIANDSTLGFVNANSTLNNSGLIEGVGLIHLLGGTLTNTGTGTLAPGDVDGNADLGTLTINGNLQLDEFSKVFFDLNKTGSDSIAVTGKIDLMGTKGPSFNFSEFNGPSFTGLESAVTLMTSGGNFNGLPSQYSWTNGSSDIDFSANADFAGKALTAQVVAIDNHWSNATPSGGDWFTNTNWSRGTAPNQVHNVFIDQPAANLVTITSGAAYARTVILGDGTHANTLAITGSGASLTVNDPASSVDPLVDVYSGSTLSLSSGASLMLGAGTMYVDPGALLQLNAGTVSAFGGSQGNAYLNNQGLILSNGPSVLGNPANGKEIILDNQDSTGFGTIEVASGELQIQSASFYQNGLIKIGSNTSTLSYLPGTLFNDGTIEIAGGRLNVGTNAITNFDTIKGTGVIEANSLFNEGTIEVGSTPSLGSLTLTGDFSQDTSGTLKIRTFSPTTSDSLIINGSSVSLAGSLVLTAVNLHAMAAGDIYQPIVTSSVIPTGTFGTVSGIGLLIPSQNATASGHFITLANPASSILWDGSEGDGLWSNPLNWDLNRVPQVGDTAIIDPIGAQTIQINSGTDLSILSLSATSKDDRIEIFTNGTLSLGGGANTLNGELWVNGGTLNFNGNNTVSKVELSAGQLNVSSNVTVQVGTLYLFQGSLDIANSGAMNITSQGLWNGAAGVSGGGSLVVDSGANLQISGAGNRTVSGSGTTLQVDGLLRMGLSNAGDKLDIGSGASLLNQGIIVAGPAGYSTQTIGGAGLLDNQGGTIKVDSISNAILNINTTDLNVNGGTFDALGAGNGLILIESAGSTMTGSVTFASGTTQISDGVHQLSNLTLASNGMGTLRIAANADVTFSDVTAGSHLQLFGGVISIASGKTIGVSSNSVLEIETDVFGAGSVENAGYLSISSASVAPQINNSATLAVIGTSTIDSLSQVSGAVLRLYSGASLTHSAGDLTHGSNTRIEGDGTINVGSGTLISAGIIAPGYSGVEGKITIEGKADLTGSKLEIDLISASQYDKLHVTQQLQMGTGMGITVSEFSPFLAGGETFQPLSYGGTASGPLPTITSLVSGKSFAVSQASALNSAFTLTASGGFVTNIFWDSGGDGISWSDPLNWSTDLLPIAGQNVTLDSLSNTVTIATGTNVSGLIGFNLDATDALFITGGALSLPSTNLNLLGTVNLQGGTLTLPSTGGNVAGQFTWSGGTVNGSGNWTGANLSGSGSRTLAMGASDSLSVIGALTGGSLSLQSGAISNVSGFSVISGATLSYDGGYVSTALLSNDGLIKINTGSVMLPIAPVTNGSFEIASGAELSFFNSTALGAGASITGGTLTVASGKTLDTLGAGLFNRGSNSVTRIGGSLVTAGLVTDELSFNTGGVLSGNAGSALRVNVAWDDSNAASITGFGSATITQASGDLVLNKNLTVTGAAVLSAVSGDIENTTNGAMLTAGSVNANTSGMIDLKVASNIIGASSASDSIFLDITGPTQIGSLSTAAGEVASITSTGNVGQTGVINTSGQILLDIGTNGVSWTNGSNRYGEGVHLVSAGTAQLLSNTASPFVVSGSASNLQAGGGAVQLGSSLGSLDVSGPLTVNATGNISQGAALNITGLADLTGQSITLSTASTYGGGVQFAASGSVLLNATGALDIRGSTPGSLSLTATGNITQSGTLNVGGAASLTATGKNIILNNAGNNFLSVHAVADQINLTDADTSTNGLAISGTLGTIASYVVGGNLTSNGLLTSSVLNVNNSTAGRSVNLGSLNVSNLVSFNTSVGAYTDISYNNAGIAQLGAPIVVTGNVSITTAGGLTLPSVTASSFTLNANGAIGQVNGSSIYAPISNINTTTGFDISLTEVANVLESFSSSGRDISVVSSKTLNPQISSSRNVSLNAPDIVQSAGHAIQSSSLAANATGGIDLLGSNNVGSFAATTAGGIALNNPGGPLVLDQINAPTGISINAGAALTQVSGKTLSASQVQLQAGSIGSSSSPVVVDAPLVRASATAGDAYLSNPQSSELRGLQAAGTASYVSNLDIEVTGNVAATNVVLQAGADLDIGNLASPVSIKASNSVSLQGANISLMGGAAAGASATVQSEGSVSINSAGTFVIEGGSQSGTQAQVKALGAVNVLVAGTLSVVGGTGDGSYALLDPAAGVPMTITANAINLTGGAGQGAYAAIASDGDITLNAPSLSMTLGTGADADAVVVSNFGRITAPGNCNGCVDLNLFPLGNGASNTGLYEGARIIGQSNSTNLLSTQLSQIAVVLDDAQRDPEERRDPEPDIVVEGQNCP